MTREAVADSFSDSATSEDEERRSITYRPDIDGLRALAITLVVAYHVGIPGVDGGFIGVDVFFVISGFLITAILWKELGQADGLDWGRFYARRVRRLIPALTMVVLVVLALGVWLMLPDPELRWLGQSAVSVATFLSNLFFETKTEGYFAADAEQLPLLNTWSLAVEEQFYLVWPPTLLVLWRIARRRGKKGPRLAAPIAATGIAVLAGISLVASEVVVRDDQAAAFYLMPYRLWELAAGGFLAVILWKIPRTSRRTAAIIAVVGLLLVGYSAVTMTRFDVFPGFAALPTVIGTVLVVIAGTAAIGNPVSAFLSLGPLVRVGALSYSWYLIHWPLLVFARLDAVGPDLLRDSAIALVSLGLAALSYRYVEQPFREGRWPALRKTRPTLWVGLAMLLTMAVAGLVVLAWPNKLSRIEVSEAEQVALGDDPFQRCRFNPTGSPDAIDCSFSGPSEQTLVAVGDSHAATLTPAAWEFAEKHR